MLRWIKRHIEILLLFTSVIFVVLLIAYYVLVIQSVGARLETALNPNAAVLEQKKFDIETASKLNLKGLRPAPTAE